MEIHPSCSEINFYIARYFILYGGIRGKHNEYENCQKIILRHKEMFRYKTTGVRSILNRIHVRGDNWIPY